MKPEGPATNILSPIEVCEATFQEMFGRREFLFIAGSSVLLAALPGCGGSGGLGSGSGVITSGALVPTGRLSGTANAAHFGGKGLAVGSSYQADVTVSATGAFSTTVSSSGAQLLTVSDSAGNLRGLATSVPGSSMTIDATSTALAMIFMTPGIVTIDPTEAATRLASIKGLTSFAALNAYLLQNLPNASIASLIKTGQVTTLKKAVVTDYLTAFPPHAAPAIKRASSGSRSVSQGPGTPDDTNVRVTATQGTIGDSGTPFNLSNEDWRYVTVYRQYLGTIGDELAPYQEASLTGTTNPTFDAGILGGANAVSVGALLTNQVGSSGSGTETLDLTKVGGLASVRYWIIGPGLALIQNQLPASMPESQLSTTTYGLTTFYYLVMPILDFVIGSSVSVELGPKFIAGYWKTLSTELNFDNLIVAFKSGMASNVEIALIDFVNLISPSIRDILIYLGGTVKEGAWVDKALKLFETTALVVDGANVAVLIANLQFVPRIAHVTVTASPSGNYSVADIGSVTGNNTLLPTTINNKGQMAGRLNTGYDAFVYDGAKIVSLLALIPGAIDIDFENSLHINNNGQVVGKANFLINPAVPSGGFRSQPFIYSNGTLTLINTPTLSEVASLAINDAGVVVGSYLDGSGRNYQGFMYANDTLTLLTLPDGTPFLPSSINNKGVVLGNSGSNVGFEVLGSPGRIWTYSAGVFTDVDPSTDPNVKHVSYLINDAGRIVYGEQDNTAAGNIIYFIEYGVATPVTVPGEPTYFFPNAINATGDFVGYSGSNGIVYTGGKVVTLPLPSGDEIYAIGLGINDSGKICLSAVTPSNTSSLVGFLLTPN